ncbi:MAG: YitT family protein [Acholeplasmatales bacterium]|nr:YitT family protein [Acholeplasmatales bacterium]
MRKHLIKSLLEITIGVFMMAFAFYFFFSPTHLVNGGISGITIILRSSPLGDISWYRDWMFMYTAQFVLLICAYVFVGKDFFLKTILASVLDPTFNLIFERLNCNPLYFLQTVPASNWYLVSTVVGGLISATGIGICLRANSSTGGMDIVQKILQQKLHIPYSKSMYLTDFFVVILAGFLVKNYSIFGIDNITTWTYNIEMVIYGICTVWLTGYICDYLALNAKTRRTAFIICDNPEIIKQYIFDEFDRGLTIVDATGGYTGNKKKMIVCTIEKAQCYILRDKIKELDPSAFTFFAETREIVGEYDS